jgi:lipopolysaccharide transport system ATP-binding protein
MSDIAINVEGLSKLYRIGSQKSGSLRETLNNTWNQLTGKNAPKASEEFWALQDVSFQIKRGEAVGIIGKNGAGKSTLLKILSRITEPTKGRIEINGRVASLLEVGTGFHPELSGRENIYLNGTILGMTRREVRAKFDEIVAFSGVEKFIDTPVKHYSSGMYVRLAFAVAAHLEPEILIIDEVLAVGDAEFQKKCLGKMEEVAGQGRTVLFVSHQMSAVAKLCNRGILMKNGAKATEGNVIDVLTAYRNSYIQANGTSVVLNSLTADKDMFLVNVEAYNMAGDACTTFTQAEDIFIRMIIKAHQLHDNARVGLRVSDKLGRNVFSTEYPLKSLFNLPGQNTLSVKVPKQFLTPSTYFLTLAVHVPNVILLDYHESLQGFSIIDVGSDLELYEGNDYGCVFANCEWSIIDHKSSSLSRQIENVI